MTLHVEAMPCTPVLCCAMLRHAVLCYAVKRAYILDGLTACPHAKNVHMYQCVHASKRTVSIVYMYGPC